MTKRAGKLPPPDADLRRAAECLARGLYALRKGHHFVPNRTSIECAAACSYLGDALYELREALDLLNGELPVEDEVREREV